MTKEMQENLLNCTSIIETKDRFGNTKIGTCFFIGHIVDDTSNCFLVTNKHVLKNQVCATVSIDLYDEKNDIYQYGCMINFPLTNNIIFHDEYDIAAINLSFINGIDLNGKRLIYTIISSEMIPNDYSIFNHIQPVIMTGYPNGIYNHNFNKPIVRTGITSSSIDKTLKEDHDFIIDIPSIGGSSGSPIFTENNNMVYLIGIVKGTYTQTVKYNIYGNRLYHKRLNSIDINAHLGTVIRSDRILSLLR